MSKSIIAFGVLITLIIVGAFGFLFWNRETQEVVGPIAQKILEKPLDKYTFKNLRKTKIPPSAIKIGKKLKEEEGFESYVFYFNVSEASLFSSKKVGKKKVSGLLNLPADRQDVPLVTEASSPATETSYPIIVMFRGFVPKEIYSIGEGTRHGGEVLAENGFITVSPDFFGYGESDNPSSIPIEERFETYTVALTLINSLKNLNDALENSNINIEADPEKVGIWGHSNGGQIAISTLEITGATMPAVLWAPVSKPFPFSILAFTDDFDDHGKALRRVVADFERDYDSEKYSPNNFYSWIKSPIQIHQGENDEAVPVWWSNSLVEDLNKLKIPVNYFTYPGLDHNFSNPTQWGMAVTRSINFYRREFEK